MLTLTPTLTLILTLTLWPGVLNEDGVRMGKANTSLLYHHNKLLALEEADLPYVTHNPNPDPNP